MEFTINTTIIYGCENDLEFNPWECSISPYNECYPGEDNLLEPTDISEYFADDEEEIKYTAMKCIMSVDGQKVIVTIDSGAAISVTTTSLMDQLGYQVDGPSDIIISALGQLTESLGVITALPLLVQGELVPTTLEVLDIEDQYLILGNDWLYKTCTSIDYGKEKLMFKYNHKEQQLPIFFDRKRRKVLNCQNNAKGVVRPKSENRRAIPNWTKSVTVPGNEG